VTLEADETDEVGEEFMEAIEDIEDVGDGLCKWIVVAGISEPRMCFVHVGATACRTYFDFSFPDDFVITTFVKFLVLISFIVIFFYKFFIVQPFISD